MTATDRARFFAGEYPIAELSRLQHRAFDSGRISVFRLPSRWAVVDPTRPRGERMDYFDTHAEAWDHALTCAADRPIPGTLGDIQITDSDAAHLRHVIAEVRRSLQAAWE